jgi:hypothetical protein
MGKAGGIKNGMWGRGGRWKFVFFVRQHGLAIIPSPFLLSPQMIDEFQVVFRPYF